MGLFTPKCPVDDETRAWVDNSMNWLLERFGTGVVTEDPVVVPSAEYFPNPFSGSEEDAEDLVARVCQFMGVDPGSIELDFYSESSPVVPDGMEHRSDEPVSGSAGVYTRERDGTQVIAIEESRLDDPMSVVATAAP